MLHVHERKQPLGGRCCTVWWSSRQRLKSHKAQCAYLPTDVRYVMTWNSKSTSVIRLVSWSYPQHLVSFCEEKKSSLLFGFLCLFCFFGHLSDFGPDYGQQFLSAILVSDFGQRFWSAISVSDFGQRFRSAISVSDFGQQFRSAISAHIFI